MTDDDAKNLQALTKEQQVQYLQREIEALRNRPPPSPQATCWTPWMDDLEPIKAQAPDQMVRASRLPQARRYSPAGVGTPWRSAPLTNHQAGIR